MKNTLIIHNGREAAYLQVARKLRGELKNGPLPSYRELAQAFGVSIGVIQRSMRMLQSEARIQIHHGKIGTVLPENSPRKELLKIALIHPYDAKMAFGQLLPQIMLQALEENRCPAMLTAHSSGADPKKERSLAETMRYNGMDGILLSPCMTRENADFFEDLAKTVPIIQIDQTIPECALPGSVVDFRGGGEQIGKTLRRRNCRNVLAIVNQSNNRSIEEMIDAMSGHVCLRLLKLPIFEAEREAGLRNFSIWDNVAGKMEETLRQEPFDAIFSPFDRYLDLALFSYLNPEFRPSSLLVALKNGVRENHSRTYVQSHIMEFSYSYVGMFRSALSRLLKWKTSGRRPRGVKKEKIILDGESNSNLPIY